MSVFTAHGDVDMLRLSESEDENDATPVETFLHRTLPGETRTRAVVHIQDGPRSPVYPSGSPIQSEYTYEDVKETPK